MNYMEWALEKAKELWRERDQVMKERLSRVVAAGSGGKAAGEMNADKTAVREAMEKRQKRGLPDEMEDAETAAQRLTRKLSGEDSGQRFKAEETEGTTSTGARGALTSVSGRRSRWWTACGCTVCRLTGKRGIPERWRCR